MDGGRHRAMLGSPTSAVNHGQARVAHRVEIAKGDAKRYTRAIEIHPDGSKTLTLTEEEPRIKDRLDALDQLDRVTGRATRN